MPLISADYFPFLVIAGFALAVFIWAEWEGRVQPMLIPKTEIMRLADEVLAAWGDRAEEFAAMEEDRAWRYSNSVEQGKWRRVRQEIARRSG